MLFRKKVITAKIEVSYGVDSVPTGALNAILTRDLSIRTFQGNTEEIRYDRAYLGLGKQLYTGLYSMLEFTVDAQGSGTAGTPPAWGPLMRACACAETAKASATGTSTASTISSVTLAAAASAVTDFYVAQAITIAGVTRNIVAYNGTTKVATVAPNFAAPPANGTYNIAAQTEYTPISDVFPSATMYFYLDGELHVLLGARGSFQLDITREALPKIKFKFMGLRVAPSTAAFPVVSTTAFQEPSPVNNAGDTLVNLLGGTPCMESFTFDAGNALNYRNLVNCEAVVISDSQATGNFTVEKPTLAQTNYDAIIAAHTLGTAFFTHGELPFVPGHGFAFFSTRCQLTNPQYSDSQGLVALSMDARFVPSDLGNDQWRVISR